MSTALMAALACLTVAAAASEAGPTLQIGTAVVTAAVLSWLRSRCVRSITALKVLGCLSGGTALLSIVAMTMSLLGPSHEEAARWAGASAAASAVLAAAIIALGRHKPEPASSRSRWAAPVGVFSAAGVAVALVSVSPLAAWFTPSSLGRGPGPHGVPPPSPAGLPPFLTDWLPVFTMLLAMGTCTLITLFELSRDLHRTLPVDAGAESVDRLRAEALHHRHRSLHDPLTGLANRELFQQLLEGELSPEVQNPQLVGVIFCDLDRFKPVNDELGHAAGDAVLTEIARRLEGAVRAEDTVARLGGDEFAIVCPRLGRPGAEEVASRIREEVERPYELPSGDIVRLGLSLGIAAGGYPLTGPELVRDADRAMYDDKRRRTLGHRGAAPG